MPRSRKVYQMQTFHQSSTKRTVLWLIIALSLLALIDLSAYRSTASGLPQSQTVIKIMPQTLKLKVDETAKIDLTIDQVSGLYGIELHLKFDPNVIQVIDAQPDQKGIQIQAGDMPIPDFIVLNTADNVNGTIDYAVTQLPPNPPGEGNGVIASLTIRAKKAAATNIQVEQFLLADTAGKSIDAASQHGQIQVVGGSNWLYLTIGGVILIGLSAGVGFIIINRKRA